MKLSIIIVNWNTGDLLKQCLQSIDQSGIDLEYHIWVVDNASQDEGIALAENCHIIFTLVNNKENLGFSRANNQAARLTSDGLLLFLNPDTLVHPGTINTLAKYLVSHPEIAAVGPKLLNDNGSLQISAFPAPTIGRELWRLFNLDRLIPISQYPLSYFNQEHPKLAEVLNGACLLVRGDVFREVGCFDEDYYIYSEEVDLCEKIRKQGWKLYWVPEAKVTHIGGISTRQLGEAMFIELYRNKIKFFRKHRGIFQTIIYRYILTLASIVRVISGKLMLEMKVGNRSNWLILSRNYQNLLSILPNL